MKILVIGDTCTDIFVYGTCDRLCPEGPVPVFKPKKVITNPGMAGNVAANLTSLGENVTLIGNKEEITKKRYVEEKSNHLFIRVDENDYVKDRFKIEDVDLTKFDAVVVADYNKGFLSVNDLIEISQNHEYTFLDTKKILGTWAKNFKFIKINEIEWDNCVKNGLQYDEWKDQLIVTKSSKGCLYNNELFKVEKNLDVRDISGAGDTFMAGFVSSYMEKKNILVALEYANKCASTVIQKRGVSVI